ncbi:hypothetical protein Cgig2_030733 [Carnegiea gigantea]|uniref:PRP1 splicing factor N-terminal domain-containing protein n=1 Tax=Carnegiea gigantea TaxID=171969 RepID=A0A9Q1KUI3_9CARY|nr:hypothetical protein Cgig2_030733 [Carnegiea gigantea]
MAGLNSTSTLDVSVCDGTKPKNRADSPNPKPPANYVAGSGRGGTGSDNGPARAAPDLPMDPLVALVWAVGRQRGQVFFGGGGGYDDKGKGDGFEGNDAGLCKHDEDDEYDEYDEEADAIWKAVDRHMEIRRKKSDTLSDTEMSDINNVRSLFKHLAKSTQTYVKCRPPLIEAARLVELAGKIQTARQLIEEGCQECPKNEDLWLEACRLASPDDAKVVIARGVQAIPNSVKLWLQAAILEEDDTNNSRLLGKGLEHIPDSVKLLKAAVELANEEGYCFTGLSSAALCMPSFGLLLPASKRMTWPRKYLTELGKSSQKSQPFGYLLPSWKKLMAINIRFKDKAVIPLGREENARDNNKH